MLMLWVVVIMLFVGHSNRALYRIVPTFKNMCTALWICSALLCSCRAQLVQCTVFLLTRCQPITFLKFQFLLLPSVP